MKTFQLLIVLILFNLPSQLSADIIAEQKAIHVKVKGEGEPIMLIPGFTVPGEIWNPLVEQLKSKYQCHIVTLAGFGGTAPIEFPWLPKINSALEDYIIKNQLNDLTIIGHSLGGTVATWLGTRENINIKELILVDALPATGALMIPNFNPDDLAYESSYNMQQLQLPAKDFEQMASVMATGMSLNSDAQKQIKDWIVNTDRKTYVYGYTDYLKLDLRKDLEKITIPVTIIAADQPYGKEMVTNTYKNQYSNLESYDLIIAENAAHFVMLDQEDWFIKQIKECLEL